MCFESLYEIYQYLSGHRANGGNEGLLHRDSKRHPVGLYRERPKRSAQDLCEYSLLFLLHLILSLSYFFLISSSSSRFHTSFSYPPHPLALILLSHLLIILLTTITTLRVDFDLLKSQEWCCLLPVSKMTLVISLKDDTGHQSQGRHWSSVSRTILVISLNDDTGHQFERRHWSSVSRTTLVISLKDGTGHQSKGQHWSSV